MGRRVRAVTTGTPKERHDWKPQWLNIYRETGMVTAACEGAGVSRTHAYRVRSEDEEFRKRWDDADEAATESLEKIARRRAENGSDVLTIFLLKARRPATYRENIRTEISGPEGGPIQYVEGFTDHERAALRKALESVTEGTPVGSSEPTT